jgi:hypothetical protein
MKHREDITEYLISQLGDYCKNKEYKIYEQDGLLYLANYNEDEENILYFTPYSLLWHKNHQKTKQNIIEKFNVNFDLDSNIVCKCGNDKNFSAQYGDYELFLICNSCGNKFSAYSG